MASNISAVKCPHCGRSAIEDYYYKTDETTIICYRCGYNYSRKIKNWTTSPIKFEENEYEGFGVIVIVKKDGQGTTTMLNGQLTKKRIEEYHIKLSRDDVDQSQSYFILFEDGVFTVEFGTPSENFHLTFEKYKEKMIEIYGEHEYSDVLVPIEM